MSLESELVRVWHGASWREQAQPVMSPVSSRRALRRFAGRPHASYAEILAVLTDEWQSTIAIAQKIAWDRNRCREGLRALLNRGEVSKRMPNGPRSRHTTAEWRRA